MSKMKTLRSIAGGVLIAIGTVEIGTGLVEKFNLPANANEAASSCENRLKANQPCSLEEQQNLLAVKNANAHIAMGVIFAFNGSFNFLRALTP